MDHEVIDALDVRVATLEAALKKMQDRLDQVQRQAKAAAAATGGNAAAVDLPKWAAQWLSHFDGRGIPRARAASLTECRKIGGAGKGDWAGDPIVRRDPPKWDGKSYSGMPMSLTSPDYLDRIADFNEWKASMALKDTDEEKRKYVTYNLRDAALAKGWAAILRDPAHTPEAALADGAVDRDFDDANEDIPF